MWRPLVSVAAVLLVGICHGQEDIALTDATTVTPDLTLDQLEFPTGYEWLSDHFANTLEEMPTLSEEQLVELQATMSPEHFQFLIQAMQQFSAESEEEVETEEMIEDVDAETTPLSALEPEMEEEEETGTLLDWDALFMSTTASPFESTTSLDTEAFDDEYYNYYDDSDYDDDVEYEPTTAAHSSEEDEQSNEIVEDEMAEDDRLEEELDELDHEKEIAREELEQEEKEAENNEDEFGQSNGEESEEEIFNEEVEDLEEQIEEENEELEQEQEEAERELESEQAEEEQELENERDEAAEEWDDERAEATGFDNYEYETTPYTMTESYEDNGERHRFHSKRYNRHTPIWIIVASSFAGLVALVMTVIGVMMCCRRQYRSGPQYKAFDNQPYFTAQEKKVPLV